MTLLKVRINVRMDHGWLKKWVKTRREIIKQLLGENPEIKVFNAGRGYYVEIKVSKQLPDHNLNMLQLLLGDDHIRVKRNRLLISNKIQNWNDFRLDQPMPTHVKRAMSHFHIN